MSNSEDQSKPNGLSTDPLHRLASFKPPRDLSLGGAKLNKKVFVPNLSVARNKNKGPILVNSRDHKRDDKGRKNDRRNDRNKNFKNGSTIIKSTGVFSEGLGSAERHSTRASYGSREGGGEPGSTLQKPTLRVKDFIKIDKELEDQKIKSAVECGVNDEEYNFRKMNAIDDPVKLPMDDGWSHSQTNPAVKPKQEVIVKKEPTEELDGASPMPLETKPLVDIKESFEDTSVLNIIKTETPTLLLLQLPDTLPGRGGSVDDDIPRRKPEDASEAREEKPVDTRCHLRDLEEGRIGKLRVHRSGRVSVALGDTIFEVSTGTKASFYQEAVSVATDDASRSANIVSLGAISHKLNIVPDWETLFSNMATS